MPRIRSIVYISGNSRGVLSSGSNSENKTCNKAFESNANMCIGIELDKQLDLGQLLYNDTSYSLFSSGDKL